MKRIKYEEIVTPSLIDNAILHTHDLFIKDYLILHALLKKYDIKSVFEVGTHTGEGTNIICNAVKDAEVYSLDLPIEFSGQTLQHPQYKNMIVGQVCKIKYNQLLNDSMLFDYSTCPCEAYFIDGEHDYIHPRHETTEIIKQNPKLIIWHDADIIEVGNAINDSFVWNNNYQLYRVIGTAIAYAIRI